MSNRLPKHSTTDPLSAGVQSRLTALAKSAFKNVPNSMTAFVVGGAVRDSLLGLPVNDIDFLVIGESQRSMLEHGFAPVGKDFPVFLDVWGRQFALARKERSTGPGHKDYDMWTEGVSIADDLYRRDLTINAMAIDRNGFLLDPFNGQRDLGLSSAIPSMAINLRPVSKHFWEDPLRVLRVCRLGGKLESYGFTVQLEDNFLTDMQNQVRTGMLANLPKERIFSEFEKILVTTKPSKGLALLGLTEVWATLCNSSLVGCAWENALRQVEVSTPYITSTAVRFGSLVMNMDSTKSVIKVCQTLSVPVRWTETALSLFNAKQICPLQGEYLSAEKTYSLMETLRRGASPNFDDMLHVIVGPSLYSHYNYCANLMQGVTGYHILSSASHAGKPPGKWVRTALRDLRVDTLQRYLNNRSEPAQNYDFGR